MTLDPAHMTRFPDRLIDHAGAQHQAEQFHQPLANTRPRQAHTQPEENEESGQLGAHQAPLTQFDLLPLAVRRRPPRLRTADMAASADDFQQKVTRDTEQQPDRAVDLRRNVDFVPARVSL